MKTELLRLETGILLDESHPEFDKYSKVFTGKHGFYDEDVTIYFDYHEAEKDADDCMSNGEDKTYAVISSDVFNITENEKREIQNNRTFKRSNDFSYAEDDIIYFAYKENEKIKK